ncbi:MAG: GNAT family N-acetyltransferase [Candidatus Heimdallarchaeaceae archaeon]
MKNLQIKINIHNEQLDFLELATFTVDLWKITRPEINASVEGLENWIKDLRYDEAPILVKAYTEEKLVGWLLLFVHDSKKLEINPWALGGHPLISLDEPIKSEVTKLLLTECIDYAERNNHTRIELCFEKKESMEQYPVDPSLYSQVDFKEEDEIVFMSLNLAEQEISEVEFSNEIEILLLKDVDDNDLYSCFYDSFSESGDRNFLSETDEEREEYFKEHFDKEDEMIDEASIVLVEGTKLIGFTLVKPTHGEGNGHLWIMGVIPEYRGRQLGSKLLHHAIDTLKKQGYKTMSLVVDSANEAALRLYEKHHFVKGWKRISHAWKKDFLSV